MFINSFLTLPCFLLPMKLNFKYIFLFLLILTTGYAKAEKADTLSISAADSLTIKSDSLMIAYLAGQGIPVTKDNDLKLLKSGHEKFENLFADIRKAKHYIHLEYFNFRNDSIANALFELLAVKAKEGVKIRALFDAFGNWSNSRPLRKEHLKVIRQKGIEIYHFDPIRFPYLNHIMHRDHRKIVVIDGIVSYTGGMNIADYYINGLPEIGTWRDMHLRIEGSATKFLQEIFLTMWNKTTKQDIGGEEYFPLLSDSLLLAGNKAVAIVDRAPRKTPKQIRHAFIQTIRSAQEKIQIVNPYFLPTHSIKKELKRALKRGIDVEVMISTKADIPFTPDATFYYAHKLMKKGARIYMYNGGFHHSKTMMVDDTYCTVGSANLNSRSLRYDYEVNAFIFDKEITDELTDLFQEDKEHCTELTPEVWKKRSGWKKFVGWFAHLFTPVL